MPRPVKRMRAECTAIVLVCRKCSKRLHGGFGSSGDERFAKALRRSLADRPGVGSAGKRPRKSATAVVEVGCLDVCPKGSVMTLRADRPGDWLAVPRGTDMAEVVDCLGLAVPTAPFGG